MTPEQWSRIRVYDPDLDNPDPNPRANRPPPDRLQSTLGCAFMLLAALAFGALIGWGLK